MNNSSYASQYYINKKLSELLSVSVVKIGVKNMIPFVILTVWNNDYISFCEEQGIIDLSHPLILDPITKDFNSEDVEKTLRLLNVKY